MIHPCAGGNAYQFTTMERRWERDDGGALEAIAAHTRVTDLPIVPWDDPFCLTVEGHGVQWHDDDSSAAAALLSHFLTSSICTMARASATVRTVASFGQDRRPNERLS